MISVVICRRRDADWHIDTWLMSCRVLGRKVEQAVLSILCAAAAERGIHRLIGRYLPSGRNGLVEGHYENLEFSLLERRADGATTWTLEVGALPLRDLPIRVQYMDAGLRKVEYAGEEGATVA